MNDEICPDYVAAYAASFEEAAKANGYFVNGSIGKTNPTGMFKLALLGMQLSRCTGQGNYGLMAQRAFGIGLSAAIGIREDRKLKNINEFDCFLFAPLLRSARRIKEGGLFLSEWDKHFEVMIQDGISIGLLYAKSRAHGNRVMVPMAGIAALVQMYPGDQRMIELRQEVKWYWDSVKEAGDLDENSGNYSMLGISGMIALAQELGCEDDLKEDVFRHSLEKFLPLVSPEGYVPEFGDDYFDVRPKDYWVNIMEYAATLYGNPQFSGVARKLYRSQQLRGGRIGYDLALLLDIKLLKQAEEVLPSNSLITTRRAPSGAMVPDKLVMRTGQKPGCAMVLFDLYSRGDHSQPEKRASLAYLEAGGTPLFYNYGRYLGSAIYGNQVVMGAPGEDWPYGDCWKPNTWRTNIIPTERLATPENPSDLMERQLLGFSFRTEPPRKGQDTKVFIIDNMRLEGPAGVILLDGFEAYEPTGDRNKYWWCGSPSDMSLVNDCTEGRSALRIEVRSSGYNAPYGFGGHRFSCRDYPYLKYDVKYLGPRPDGIGVRTPSVRGGLMSWSGLANVMLMADLDGAEVRQSGNDVFATIGFKGYGTLDSSLRREIALTKEGVVVIKDILAPGEMADGMEAGVLWQMYSLDQRGPNWFTSWGERPLVSLDPAVAFGGLGMTACFIPDPEGKAGAMKVDDRKYGQSMNFQYDRTVHAPFVKCVQRAGKSWTNWTVVVPHSRQALGQEVSSLIGGIRDGVRVALPGCTVEVTPGVSGVIARANNSIEYGLRPIIDVDSRDGYGVALRDGGAQRSDRVIQKWTRGEIRFPIMVPKTTRYHVLVEQASVFGGRQYRIECDGRAIDAMMVATGGNDRFEWKNVGVIELTSGAWRILTITPYQQGDQRSVINMRRFSLVAEGTAMPCVESRHVGGMTIR
ncbi:MAG: hypothetical protein L6R48_07360 [Planctomycetes bacterium]|nr:hypothetical protein [Planctomycetota bacterium]